MENMRRLTLYEMEGEHFSIVEEENCTDMVFMSLKKQFPDSFIVNKPLVIEEKHRDKDPEEIANEEAEKNFSDEMAVASLFMQLLLVSKKMGQGVIPDGSNTITVQTDDGDVDTSLVVSAANQLANHDDVGGFKILIELKDKSVVITEDGDVNVE